MGQCRFGGFIEVLCIQGLLVFGVRCVLMFGGNRGILLVCIIIQCMIVCRQLSGSIVSYMKFGSCVFLVKMCFLQDVKFLCLLFSGMQQCIVFMMVVGFFFMQCCRNFQWVYVFLMWEVVMQNVNVFCIVMLFVFRISSWIFQLYYLKVLVSWLSVKYIWFQGVLRVVLFSWNMCIC